LERLDNNSELVDELLTSQHSEHENTTKQLDLIYYLFKCQ